MKTRAEARHKARIYYQKALRYSSAARDNHDAGLHDPAMSNAIHAVINLVDAICIQVSGLRSSSGDHGDAVRLLAKSKVDPKVREAVGKRLISLLSVKHLAEHEGTLITPAQSAAAIKDLERALIAISSFARNNSWE